MSGVYWYYCRWLLLKYRKGLACLQCWVSKFEEKKSIPSCPYNLFLFCLVRFDYHPFWEAETINIGRDMGKTIRTNKLFLAFCYCNSFFKMIKSMKRWWDAISQKHPVHIPGPTTAIPAHILGLIDQSNYRISQDISLQ